MSRHERPDALQILVEWSEVKSAESGSRGVNAWGVTAIILWTLIAISFALLVASVVLRPMQLSAWRSAGLKEPPIGWSLLIDLFDLFDFGIRRWFLIYPLPIAIAVYASFQSTKLVRRSDG